MSRLRYRMTGQRRLSKAFRSLGEVAVHTGLRTAVEAGARVVRAGARERAPRRTGTGARRMVAEIMVDEKGRGRVVAAVGPHKKHGWYLLFHEIGFRKHPATPFLRPALDESRAEVESTIARTYWDNLRRVAASLGAVRGR